MIIKTPWNSLGLNLGQHIACDCRCAVMMDILSWFKFSEREKTNKKCDDLNFSLFYYIEKFKEKLI